MFERALTSGATNGIEHESAVLQRTYDSGGEHPRYYNPDILNEVRVKLLEEGIPRHRGNVTVTQSILHNFGVLGRVNYYGPWYENAVGSQTYDGAYLVDLETNYTFDENMSITIGVQNALNVEPDNVTSSDPDIENFTAKIVGRPFGEYSPYGFGGAFWYAKYNYNF